MKYILLASLSFLFLSSVLGLSSLAEESKESVEEITITIEPACEFVEYGAPVPVKMSLKNNTDQTLRFLFNYVMHPSIQFSVKDSGKVRNKPQPLYFSASQGPVPISGGSTHLVTFYLNRLIEFKTPGEFQVNYKADIEYYKGGRRRPSADTARHVKAQGSLKIVLKEVDEETLRTRLRLIAESIRNNDKDRERELEVVEALCHLESPLSIPFLAEIANKGDLMDHSEAQIIGAIVRFQTLESQETLESIIRHDPDSGIVWDALDALSKKGKLLDDDMIKRLLSSKNNTPRYATIEHLSNLGNASHIAMLQPLLKDNNSRLAKVAKDCINKLRNKPM